MDKRRIPVIHYPKGNPLSGQTWPELSFRSLLRHIHRQQRFWGDLAEMQPESDQHACLLQFLGLAEILFSDDYSELVKLKTNSQLLKARRAQYGQTLEDVTRGVLSDPGLSVNLNPQSLRSAQERTDGEIASLEHKRLELLNNAQSTMVEVSQQRRVSFLGSRRAELLITIEELKLNLSSAKVRLNGLLRDRDELLSEIARLERANDAGEVLSDLRITHCPACDQPAPKSRTAVGSCFLCHQQLPQEEDNAQLGAVRINFENKRLT
jgi:hypothetical protein